MFRVLKIASSVRPFLHPQFYSFRSTDRLGILFKNSFGKTQRFYAKKIGDECCNKEVPCKAPKPVQPECKPDTHLQPCAPRPVDCGYGRKPLPYYHDCPKPNRMDKIPKLQCPHGGNDGRRKKKYFLVLTIGALVLLITLGVLYSIQKPKKDIREKRKLRKKVRKKVPARSSYIPKEIPYLLIGGGTASFSAFRAIKSADPETRILIIAEENDYPYMRPPLSKEMWCSTDLATKELLFKQWNGIERSLFYEPDDFYLNCKEMSKNKNLIGVAVARGWNVNKIDACERKAILEDGYEISYGKCLIATGSTPKNLDIFEKAPEMIKDKISTYRDIFDFQKLHEVCETAEQIAVIGGGFLGSELACSLARKGKNKFSVIQVYREGGNMAEILPEYLSYYTTEKVKEEGVTVIPYAEITGVSLDDQEKINLNLSTDQIVTADYVIVAIGADPNTSIAEASELELHPELGGFLVNTELQARSDLYAAGDCSCFYDTKFGRRRVEHHDHAVVSGRLAGENMTGTCKKYWHQSMFWSDLTNELGYEAVGIVDSKLPTVGVFAKPSIEDPAGLVTATDEGLADEPNIPPECEPYIQTNPEQRKLAEQVRIYERQAQRGEDFDKGVIFYLRDDTVVGIVLWNLFNRMHIARQVLKDDKKYDDLNEVAKLFDIHGDGSRGEPEEEEILC